MAAPNPDADTLLLAKYVTKASVSLAILAFIAGILLDYRRKVGAALETHLARLSAAGAVPTALVLVYAAFEPSIIAHLAGLNVPIAAAGLALLYISVKTVFSSLPEAAPKEASQIIEKPVSK